MMEQFMERYVLTVKINDTRFTTLDYAMDIANFIIQSNNKNAQECISGDDDEYCAITDFMDVGENEFEIWFQADNLNSRHTSARWKAKVIIEGLQKYGGDPFRTGDWKLTNNFKEVELLKESA